MIRAEKGLLIKERMKRFNDLKVRRILLKRSVIEEFEEGREGGISVAR